MNLSEKMDSAKTPPKQNKKPMPKAPMPILIIGALILAIGFVTAIVYPLLTKGGGTTLTPENSIVSYVPAEGVEPIEVDVKQLMDDVDALKQQAEASPANSSGDSDVYLPEGVSSIAEFNRDEADFLKPSSLRKANEPIPYKKGYKQLSNNQYAFFLTIDYGGSTSSIPVHYSDFKELKPEGVTYFIVEYAEVKPNTEDATYTGVVTGITLDPYWRENLEPQRS